MHWENHGKIMGENHGKIMGKSWENHGKISRKSVFFSKYRDKNGNFLKMSIF